MIKILFFCVCLIIPSVSFSWDNVKTHPDITENAINGSLLDEYIVNNLGLDGGTNYELKNGDWPWALKKDIRTWIKYGAEKEDKPKCRASNHFQNPLITPWYAAGLDDPYLPSDIYCAFSFHPNSSGEARSNLDWGTGYTVSSYLPSGQFDIEGMEMNEWDWSSAREYFHTFLTGNNFDGTPKASDEDERQEYLARCFRALGQVLHLLQDVAVPAHTRNDYSQGHTDKVSDPDATLGRGNRFESHVKMKQDNANWFNSIEKGNLEQSGSLSGLHLTKFWDTDVYDGQDPDTLDMESIGLAEYSNMNFVSAYTIFKPSNDPHYFPYPNMDSIVPATSSFIEETCEDGSKHNVLYFNKYKNGEIIKPFLAVSFLSKEASVIDLKDKFTVTEKCFDQYASKLIPKAIGYSAQLIDYFFRGQLEITAPDEFVYAIIDGSITPQQFNKITAKVRNISPREKDEQGNTISYEPIEDGELLAVAKYKIRTDYDPDLSEDPPTEEEMQGVEFSYSVSKSVEISPPSQDCEANPDCHSLSSDRAEEIEFDFSQDLIPVGITDLYLQIIFKGTLGNEEDIGVAVGMKDLNEPDHYTIWNSTDMIDLFGVLRTPEEIYNNPNLFRLVDTNNNGALDDNECQIDSFNIMYSVAFFPKDDTSFNCYNATYDTLLPETYGKFIVLTGEPEFNVYYKTESVRQGMIPYLYNISGTVNQMNETDWEDTCVINFRGINSHFYFSMSTCCNATGDCSGNHVFPNVEGDNLIPVQATNLVP